MWLQRGAIDKSTDLESDLTAPMFGYDIKNNNLLLESKKAIKERRGTSEYSGSTDEGDALALTFARMVAPLTKYQVMAREEDEDGDYIADEFGAYTSVKFTGWG